MTYGSMEYSKVCEYCGQQFIAKKSDTRYCGKICDRKQYKEKNRDRINKWQREWNKNNKDKVRANNKKWLENNKEKAKEIAKKWRNKHKDYLVKTGLTAYSAIKSRCNNPNHKSYKYYGARGIKCLLSWNEFRALYFCNSHCPKCHCELTRTGPTKRSLDRINNNGHYELSNVQVLCIKCNQRKLISQECPTCGKTYVESGRTKYCSIECWPSRKIKERKCKACGNTIKSRKYCNGYCRRMYRNNKNNADYDFSRMQYRKVCRCNKVFYTKYGQARYCGRKCYMKWYWA